MLVHAKLGIVILENHKLLFTNLHDPFQPVVFCGGGPQVCQVLRRWSWNFTYLTDVISNTGNRERIVYNQAFTNPWTDKIPPACPNSVLSIGYQRQQLNSSTPCTIFQGEMICHIVIPIIGLAALQHRLIGYAYGLP